MLELLLHFHAENMNILHPKACWVFLKTPNSSQFEFLIKIHARNMTVFLKQKSPASNIIKSLEL